MNCEPFGDPHAGNPHAEEPLPEPLFELPDGPVDWPTLGRALHLTPRQTQVMQLMVERDLTANSIATHLGIAERTVTTHLNNIHRRLNVRSRAGVVIRAWDMWLELTRRRVANPFDAAHYQPPHTNNHSNHTGDNDADHHAADTRDNHFYSPNGNHIHYSAPTRAPDAASLKKQ